MTGCSFVAGKRNREAQPQIEQSAEQRQLAKQQFEKLTEAASTLMDTGELDVYSHKRVGLSVPSSSA